MSYLLEALRKSERERQEKSPVPGLQTPTVEWESGEEARTRSPWLMVAVLAICLNTILLAVLVWRFGFADNDPEPAVEARTPAPLEARPAAALPPVIVVQQPAAASPAVLVRERAPANTVAASNAGYRLGGNGAPENSSTNSSSHSTTGNTASNTTGTKARQPLTRLSETSARIPHATATRDPLASSDDGGAELDIDAAELPSVHALPVAVRQQLPLLTMNSHIYANNARDSFVMINGVSLSPGQTITPGLTLIAVVPEGAVLSMDGQRFLLPALASFTP